MRTAAAVAAEAAVAALVAVAAEGALAALVAGGEATSGAEAGVSGAVVAGAHAVAAGAGRLGAARGRREAAEALVTHARRGLAQLEAAVRLAPARRSGASVVVQVAADAVQIEFVIGRAVRRRLGDSEGE